MRHLKYLFFVVLLASIGFQISFAHRYFDSWSARWCTPDPLAQKYPSWSPYNYGLCNPVKNVDLNGLAAGDYLDENGNKIGTDNIDDKKVYVTDQKTVAQNTKDGKTDWTAVQKDNGTALLPSASVRTELGKSIQQSTPNNEVGGLIVNTSNGDQKVVNAVPGAQTDLCKDNQAHVDPFKLQNPSDIANAISVSGDFHTHSSATLTVGNTVTSWQQPPSPEDKNYESSYQHTGNSYVFGMGNGTCYIYNSNGVIRTLPTQTFVNP
jgi:RHS repeat-associated protein